MGQKKIWETRYSSLWTLPGSWSILQSFLRGADHKILGKSSGSIGSRGFTLVELVIVIALISIFVVGAILILDPSTQIQKGNDSKRKSDLSQIQKSLEVYYNDFAKYPPSSPSYRIMFPDTTELNWDTQFGNYMTKLPKDPKSPSMSYVYFSTGQAYYLYASLEKKNKDSQVCNPDGDTATDDKCTNAPVGASCGGICNYGVSSSNVSP